MLNRFKLLVFAIILAVLAILFFQNRESLSLKFLCSDTTSEYCLYQTPSISLAIWMAIFIVAGIVSSLIWQLLSRAGSPTKNNLKSSSPSQSSQASQTRTSYREDSNLREETSFGTTNRGFYDTTNPNNSNVSDWEQQKSDDWEPTNVPNFAKDYDVPRQSPDNMRPGETNYAYKFRKDNESNSRVPPFEGKRGQARVSEDKPWANETRQGRSSKENSNSESDKPPVSKNTEEVYDANYRTLNNIPPPSVPEDLEDDDSDWI